MTNVLRKTILITGAGNGIGLAAAEAFARAGSNVVLADRNFEAVSLAAERLCQKGKTVVATFCDVADEQSVSDAVSLAVSTFGRLDCAFNNAGVMSQRADTSALHSDEWDRVISINLKGMWLCMKHELIQMKLQGVGSIVNVSSIGGLTGVAGLPAYIASKHGVIGLTRCAALENAAMNIRINAICPGTIDTPMVQKMIAENPGLEEDFRASAPIGRLGTPAEIASAVIWLCDDSASFVTGQAIAVDGGYTVQ